MVVLFHFDTIGRISQSSLVKHSFLFVDFFFVLSGFVIAASYGEKLANGFPMSKFMGLRLGRIYPLHLAMLLVYLAFELAYASGAIGHALRPPFHPPNDLPSFIASLAMIQSFLPMDSEGWNSPSWSIQVEMWTYLLYAGVFRWARRALIPATLVLACAGAAFVYHATDHYMNVIHQGAFARCVYGFSIGVLCFRGFCAHNMKISRPAATALELVAVVGTVVLVSISGASALSMVVPVFFSGVILIFARQQGAISAVLMRPTLHLLGTLSFSIYLIHMFLIDRIANLASVVDSHTAHRFKLVINVNGYRTFGGSPIFADIVTIAVLALVVGCAYVTYHWIELPEQRWSRRKVLGN